MFRSNSEYPRWERIVISLLTFLLFAVIGILVRVSLGSIPLLPVSELLREVVPFMLGLGIPGAILAYSFPKPFSVVLWVFPWPGGNS
jgi:hypothetical protein